MALARSARILQAHALLAPSAPSGAAWEIEHALGAVWQSRPTPCAAWVRRAIQSATMRDLRHDISEHLLPRVEQPVQYVALEVNARRKDPAAAELAVALAFPDAYTVGISHLGSHVLYEALNDLPHVACDRTYCPRPDAEQVMRDHGLPLFGWESRCAVADFDVLGFSLPHELCATNVLTMLDLAGLPLRAAERGPEHPLVVGGDALAAAPEPLAEFFDVFLPGDGEVSLPALLEVIRRQKRARAGRAETLRAIARELPFAYVPRFYEPAYGPDGAFAGLRPAEAGVPEVIDHARLARLGDSPAIRRPLVPLAEGVHERVMIEVMRGCPNACRFCQAGATRRPVRWRSVDEIVSIARDAVAATGYREISLLSLSTSDYPHLAELIDRLADEFDGRHVSISLPSLRVDSQLRHLPRLTSSVRKGGLTIAAEAGSQRLRRAIGKRITETDMLAGVRAAYAAGWRSVKVYFMAGLPGERPEDVDAIFALCRRLSETGREVLGRPGAVSASVSWFVPKPHTPMQWTAMRDAEYYFWVRGRLRELSRRTPVQFKFHWVERSLLEGAVARGDRRTGRAIEAAWRRGARMDAWGEHFDDALWQAAFAEAGLDPAAAAQRELPADAPLPWGHIRCPGTSRVLGREYERMRDVLRE